MYCCGSGICLCHRHGCLSPILEVVKVNVITCPSSTLRGKHTVWQTDALIAGNINIQFDGSFIEEEEELFEALKSGSIAGLQL